MLQRRTLIVTGAVLAGLVALYAALGFLLVPKLARDALATQCRDEWRRECTVAEIRFNPFRLAAEIRELSIADADGARMLGLERLAVDFEVASLWRRAYAFSAITVEGPFVRAVQRADGTLNLLALRSKLDPARADDKLPRLAIADLRVMRGRVEVRDEGRRQPFQLTLTPLDFHLQDFSTFAEGEHFRLVAGSDRVGQIDWQGSLDTAPLASAGTIKLNGVPATTVSELLGEQLPFALPAGHIDVGFRYDFGLDGQPLRLALADGRIATRGLELRGRGREQSWTVGAIELTGATLDLGKREAHIARIALADADTPLWLDSDGLVLPGVQPLAATTTASAATTATTTDAATAPSDGGWTLAVPELVVERVHAHIEDRRDARPVPFDVTLPMLTLRNWRWPTSGTLEVDGRVESAAGGAINVKGTATPEPLATELDVAVESLSLAPLEPYIESGRALEFLGATLSAQGRLRYDADGGPRFAGDASIESLSTRDAVLREDFLRWRRLDLRGIDYAGPQDGLVIREIAAREPYLRFVIGQDGITNLKDVLDPAGARLAREAAVDERAAEAAKATAKKAAKRGRGTPRGRENAAPEPELQPPPEPLLPLPARIERVRIDAGALDFADYTTLRPYFAAAIQDLEGTIDGLSSDPAARAKVALTGKVDRYAPVTIDGEVNYLAAMSYTDLAADFRNIELTTFTPYAGKFAGYRIDKGKLTAELRYHVENRQLDAKHRIVADQLELGEKVDSPDATRLPVKLVIALLKDRHGVIDLSVPVTGTLDDPQFRLGPVIWKIVLNLLTKIVTSPFALLGGLFGDGPDLSTVDFAPGRAALDEATTTKLDTLKKGLIERPGLKLEIPAVAVEATDAPALVEARYAALLTQAAGAFAPKGGAAPALDALRAEPKRWRALLVRAYTDRVGRAPEVPKPPPPAQDSDAPPVDALAFGNEWLERELRSASQPDAEALRVLGQARAEAVRDTLLADGQVDAARVFLTQGDGATSDAGQARMTLKLE